MASYIRSWLSYNSSEPIPAAPSIIPPTVNVDEEDDNDTVKGENDDNDEPPAFPSIDSAQRIDSKPIVPLVLTDSNLMPPPPIPGRAVRTPGAPLPSSSGMLTVPSTGSSLTVPPTTTKAQPQTAKRQKVALAPGHGPLDWANLKKSGADLRVRLTS